uniref:7TM GPCR serpentine receptor class x (Srx) domain-containing protein n=2 Tax=Panagrolaimus sp. PS1159 TaxID=55785 RepID=A0AC35FN68_9BILA
MSSSIFSQSTVIDIILGTIVIIVSLLSLSFYLQILKIFYTQKTRFGTNAYRLMFQMGLTDCLQLFFHTFGGIFSIANSTFNDTFNKICGGFLNSGWIVSIFFTLLLAFNRFSTLCFRHKTILFENLFLFNTQIFISWLYFGIYFVIYMTPYCSVLYDPINLSWGYDNSEWSRTIEKIELYATLIQLSLTGILYLFIIFWLLTTKQYAENVSREYKQEFKVLIQVSSFRTFPRMADSNGF